MSSPDISSLNRAAQEARGLAMDAVAACHSGHLGLPLGAAEIGAALYGHFLRIDPAAPAWPNRDRFVLSAGHGSMFAYAWLHLAGFEVSLEDVKAFRKLHSKTPGHPEFGETPGVEATTGPLGQGTGNLVGMAIGAKMAAAHFNTPEHTIFDHLIVGLAGDHDGRAAHPGRRGRRDRRRRRDDHDDAGRDPEPEPPRQQHPTNRDTLE